MSDNYYEDVYLRRLNRYGYNYQSRVQTQREREFEGKLLKSIYRVDFDFNGETHPATLERYKQDETEVALYLLTRVSLNLPNGTVLMLPDKDFELHPWMVFWLESIKASGYNRYVVLKMTHCITWRDRDGNDQETWCYFHGSGDSAIKETIKAAGAVYVEDSNVRFAIMPLNENLHKDDYLEIGMQTIREGYRVTGYDIHSTPGVEYVSLDPMYIRDKTPAPVKKEDESSDDYFWLNGGKD